MPGRGLRLVKKGWTIDMVTITVDPLVAAAIGHAMVFAVEDNAWDTLLVDDELVEASRRFYPDAQKLAATHPNMES